MSQLKIRTKGFNEVRLNVISFMSPIFASTASSQTQASEQHHPIRCQQPNIRFDVIFRNEKEYEAWQTFIRTIQIKLLQGKDPNDVAVVTLWWPERDIRNWQGIIAETDGGGERWNWAPRTTIEVTLVKGIVAQQAALWSYGTEFAAIYGGDRNTIPPADVLITPPPSDSLNIGPGAQLDYDQLLGPQAAQLSAPGNLTIGDAGSLGPLNPPGGTVDSVIGAVR
jgi:hypothetical protein